MTRVVSTKLSDTEHEALLQVANQRGQTVSELVRNCIMVWLRGTQAKETSDGKNDRLEDLIRKMRTEIGLEHEKG